MKKIRFYNGIEEIVNNAVEATYAEVNHLFFVPETKSNTDGYCDAHRYGYNSITGKCYDLGVTDVIPKIDYTGFVFDFVPNGIHIAKKGGTTFNVDGCFYSDTKIY